MKISLKNLLIAVSLFTIFSQKAHAYLDPGTGSMVFQVVVASVLTVFYTLRSFFFKLFKTQKGKDIDK